MGQFSKSYSALNMKMLVVLALVAYVAAEPEAEAKADPWLLGGYSSLGYGGLGYSGLGYSRLGYSGLGYARHNWGYGKREAEAEPEAAADPWLVGGYSSLGYGGLGYGGLGYSGLGYSGLGYSGLGYSGLGYARHNWGYGKREAEP